MYEYSEGSDTFYGDFMAQLVWRLSEVFMEKTWSIKSPNNLHINSIVCSQA